MQSDRIRLSGRSLTPIAVAEEDLSRLGMSVDVIIHNYELQIKTDPHLQKVASHGLLVEGCAPARRVTMEHGAWSWLRLGPGPATHKKVILLPDRIAVLVRQDDFEFL